MSERERLRSEYLHRVIGALDEYLERGGVLRVHSETWPDRLDISITLDAPDLFHALCEDLDLPPTSAPNAA